LTIIKSRSDTPLLPVRAGLHPPPRDVAAAIIAAPRRGAAARRADRAGPSTSPAGPRPLSTLAEDLLPYPVDPGLEFRAGGGSSFVQIRLRRQAHDEKVLLGHPTHDRVRVEELRGLADGPNAALDGGRL